MDQDVISLSERKVDRVDRPADVIADFGHESYYELYERYRHLADDQVFVTKLEPEEEAEVRPGCTIAFEDRVGRFRVLDTILDHTSGGGATVSPGRLAILARVAGGDYAEAAGVGEEFIAAEPEGRGEEDR